MFLNFHENKIQWNICYSMCNVVYYICFEIRFECINNIAIQSLKESFEFGIQIFSNFYIYPVFLIDGFYRLCIDTSIEGISRTAGSGNSTEDVDENFF